MQNFEWQTEEDETIWETERPPAPPPPPKRRRWIYVLVAVIALFAAGLVVGRQVNQRIDETRVAIEADVRAADNLARTAAAEVDGEVMITLLSGRDPVWTQTQEGLLDAQLLYGWAAAPFGLEAQPDEYGPLTVELSNDLNQAQVSGEQLYTIQTAAGSESVALSQTWIYRRGRRNWLLSPPDDDFWGDWETTSGRYATVVFPLRDEEFALSFARDLDDALATFCAESGLECPPNLHMHVRLETDPQALLSLADPTEMLVAGSRLELPTISLVGRPVDQEAYRALVNGYSAHVLSAAVGEITGWECCAQILYYQTLVDYLLAGQGLLYRQLAPENYLDLVNIRLDDIIFDELWDIENLGAVTTDNQYLMAGLVEFLITQNYQPADMLAHLMTEPDYLPWLQNPRILSRPKLNAGWNDYIQERILAYQEREMIPADLPEDNLVLFCSPEIGAEEYQPDTIMRFHPQQERLEELAKVEDEIALGSSVAGTNSVIYTAGNLNESDVSTIYWPLDQQPITVEPQQPGDISAYIGHPVDPQGTQVPFWMFNDINAQGLSFSILDLATCTGGDSCPTVPVPGRPIWSPSGEHLALEEVDGMMLWGDRDLESWSSLGPGRSPVWLDEQTIAYLNVPGQLIRINRLDEEGATTLFDAENINELLPSNRQRFSLELQKLLYDPNRPGTLLLLASTGLSSEIFVFAIQAEEPGMDWAAAANNDALQAKLLFDGRALSYSEPDVVFSANGRWLTMRAPNGEILLYDQDTEQTTSLVQTWVFSFLQYAWSPDDTWLAYIGSNYIELIRPEPDGDLYRYFYFLDGANCGFVSWVQP
jgi:hypothetical protein